LPVAGPATNLGVRSLGLLTRHTPLSTCACDSADLFAGSGFGYNAVVTQAKQVQDLGYVVRLPEGVAHDCRETAPARFRPARCDQFVVESFGKLNIGYAVTMNMPNLVATEPVNGDIDTWGHVGAASLLPDTMPAQ
jgi:hypothetical protein